MFGLLLDQSVLMSHTFQQRAGDYIRPCEAAPPVKVAFGQGRDSSYPVDYENL
jgi:hypothetical protein